MPLIMLCGGPLSGKSVVTQRLVESASKLYPDNEVQIISYETMGVDRNAIYNKSFEEKNFNTRLISDVEKALTPRRILILDVPCLTKGIRYQFYGKANFAGTVSCVVHVTTPYEVCKERNDINHTYTDPIFEDVWNRLEPPLESCRWDYPFFETDLSSIIAPAREEQQGSTTPLTDEFIDGILHAVCDKSSKKLSKANLPTRSEKGSVADLESITTSILDQIITQQNKAGFLVGALVDGQALNISIDISQWSVPSLSPSSTDTPAVTPASPVSNTDQPSSESTDTPQPRTGSALKLVRRTVRGSAPSSTSSASSAPVTSLPLTLSKPLPSGDLMAFKTSFSRIATMMNLRTPLSIAKGFVEYLGPQLAPKGK